MDTAKRYTRSTITSIFGINKMTWADWQRKKWAPETEKKPGGWARYTLADILRIAAMVELTRAGVTPGAAAEMAKFLGPGCEAVVEHGFKHGHPALPAWSVLQRGEDGSITATNITNMDELDATADMGPILHLIDLAQLTVRTFERLVEHEDAEQEAKGVPTICPECRAKRQPSDKLFYCPHRQTLSVAEYSEHGQLQRHGYIAGVTEDQVREATRRIEEQGAKQ